MAGGGGGGATPARELDQTPTWAVAAVCAVIVVISIALEKLLHKFEKVFQEKRKKALVEALEKIKAELMVLGFISLLLTFGQNYIAKMCIPTKFANTMLPCPDRNKEDHYPKTEPHEDGGGHRRLLSYERRFLAADSAGAECKKGYVPLISVNGLHQLHIFIFFLAVFHVIYSAITMMLGRLKIRGWKVWERETVHDQEFMDASGLKLLSLFILYPSFNSFSDPFGGQDYLTMRHGFVTVHLAPGSKFDFQKYIKRSLEDDFKVVVGISPLLWASVVLFLLVNVHGWHAMVWVSILPPVVILAVGTKLQAIITKMALEIKERHAVVQGMPLVQVSDNNFWFGWPQLFLYLIHYVLFQNAFEITHFLWIWYEFGLRSCFHEDFNLMIARVALGVGVQFLCSYITLPLYALVTQMGSTMKRSIFDEQTSKALKQWHKKAVMKKNDVRGGSPTRNVGGSPDESAVQSPVVHPHGHAAGGEMSDTEVDRTAPNRTANITTSVDLPGEQQTPYGNKDLL
ncbi:MLO-like protein [Quillaja saponaria]|uniref:MLO-like protein n=1 Tax=Quillaja saponaria TaxID=32244 RepID=A0AAD7LJ68_QUISA|nr:MLO-like protein [Quillaja saponaria]